MTKFVLASFLFFLPPVAQANQWVYGQVERVDDYGSYNNGFYEVLIKLKNQEWRGVGDGATNCTERFRVKIGEQGITDKGKDRLFSLMLTAYMGGKQVGLFVDPTSGPYCLVQIGSIGDDL